MGTITSTVMFTDIVGSTEMTMALGDTRFDPVRRAHDALLRSAVESAGGTVVKGLGDGIMAIFGSAAEAIAAARSIQQLIHRRNRHQPDVLSLRIGLSVGDVIVDGSDYFGATVIEASRLCAAAQGDQILATELVRVMARLPLSPGFTVVGPLSLKGLLAPLDVVEVEWEPVRHSPTPLPPRLSSSSSSFVGRVAELSALDAAYEGVRTSGQRAVVLVGGEPGVGKTTMVSRAVQAWHEDGATVVMGWCEQDLRAPYRPFAEALGHLVATAPGDVLAAHVERHGGGLLPLAPGLADRLARIPESISSDPETERFLLFSAAADLLARVGEDSPVVLVLDDLHWADAGTASLLRSLASGMEPARLLIVGTFRDAELAGDHPMGQALASFHRVAAVQRIGLGGLSSGDVVALFENWTGGSAGSAGSQFALDVIEETGGNAFFVHELLRHLDETGQLSSLSVTNGAAMPDSLREVLGERITRLGSAAADLLAAAAIIGAEFDIRVLTAVTNLDDEKALSALADAATAALVVEVPDIPGRFRFSHALVQHAIVANLGATRQATLHRRIAEALEVGGPEGAPVAALAHHWLQATQLSDSARARDWARQAANDALAALAPGDAAVYFRQALLLHDQTKDADVGMRIDLLIGLGTAERLSGDPEYRETLLRASRLARRGGDTARLSAAVLANHRGSFSVFGDVDRDRVEMLEAALTSTSHETDRVTLIATLANELTYSGDYPRRRQLTDEALAAARATGDAALLLRVINLVFYSLWVPETLDERLTLTAESRALAVDIEDPLILFWAAMADYMNLIQSGQVAAADPILEEARVCSDRLAQPALQWRARHSQATRQLVAGTPQLAAQLAAEARDLGNLAGEPEANVYFNYQRMNWQWQEGLLGDIAPRLDANRPRNANLTASLCLIFAEGGRSDEALARLEEAAATGFDSLPRDPAYVSALAFFAEAAILLAAAEPASVLYDLLLPFESQFGFDGVTTIGALNHYLGGLARVLGRPDEAVARLTAARDFHHSIEARFFEARSHLELARALCGGGSHSAADATISLEAAIGLARSNGYRAVHNAAARLMASF
jgi:class 3 adenylate cyclase